MTESRGFIKKVLRVAAIPVLIALNWFLFRRFAHKSYFLWYLENGSLIGLATTFFRLFVRMDKFQKDLISANPNLYIAGCCEIAGIFLYSSGAIGRTPVGESKANLTSRANFFDNLGNIVLTPLTIALVVLWLLLVVPLNYLVTLIGGAQARRKLRFEAGLWRPILTRSGNKSVVKTIGPNDPIPEGAEDISFTGTPYELTQAYNAMLLWIASFLYFRFA